MKQNKTFFLIKSPFSLERLHNLLDSYEMYDLKDENSFLSLGYQTLSDSAKATYCAIKRLYALNKKKTKDLYIELSLDYLAVLLSTNQSTQSERTHALEKHGLLKIVRRKFHLNKFYIYPPVPDSTYVYTITNLIRRKQLGLSLSKYEVSTDPQEKVSLLIDIKNLVRKGATHYKLKEFNTSLLESPENFPVLI